MIQAKEQLSCLFKSAPKLCSAALRLFHRFRIVFDKPCQESCTINFCGHPGMVALDVGGGVKVGRGNLFGCGDALPDAAGDPGGFTFF